MYLFLDNCFYEVKIPHREFIKQSDYRTVEDTLIENFDNSKVLRKAAVAYHLMGQKSDLLITNPDRYSSEVSNRVCRDIPVEFSSNLREKLKDRILDIMVLGLDKPLYMSFR